MLFLRLAVSSRLLYGADNDICEWVSWKLYGRGDAFCKNSSKSIGISIGNKLIAGVVYNNMHLNKAGDPYTIEMSIATVDKRWANRHTLRALFAYPFIQLGLERVQISTSVLNEGVNSMLSRLGCVKEGFHRKAYPDGSDAYSWGMLKDECKWVK